MPRQVWVAGFAPGGDDPRDSVEVFEVPIDGVEVFGHVEEAVSDEDEAFHAPVEVGDAFDEAEFDFGGGLLVGDEGVHDFLVLAGSSLARMVNLVAVSQSRRADWEEWYFPWGVTGPRGIWYCLAGGFALGFGGGLSSVFWTSLGNGLSDFI